MKEEKASAQKIILEKIDTEKSLRSKMNCLEKEFQRLLLTTGKEFDVRRASNPSGNEAVYTTTSSPRENMAVFTITSNPSRKNVPFSSIWAEKRPEGLPDRESGSR